jgi:hypothetical protein
MMSNHISFSFRELNMRVLNTRLNYVTTLPNNKIELSKILQITIISISYNLGSCREITLSNPTSLTQWIAASSTFDSSLGTEKIGSSRSVLSPTKKPISSLIHTPIHTLLKLVENEASTLHFIKSHGGCNHFILGFTIPSFHPFFYQHFPLIDNLSRTFNFAFPL